MDFSKINTGKKSLGALFNALGKTKLVKSDFSDNTEWQLTRDKDGNGSALIRFLPAPDGEYFVEMRNHGFKMGQTWFIENCPKTLDWENPCPSCEHGESMKKGRDWDKLTESEQKLCKPFFAKTSYYSNILVEKDPANPDNEGKVFKYRFGKKILEKIAGRAEDDPLDGTEGINVFDVMEGASFKLIAKKVDGYVNYNDSSWMKSTPLCKGDDDKIDELIKSGPMISEMRELKNFKSYEDMKKRFDKVIGVSAAAPLPESKEKLPGDSVPNVGSQYKEEAKESSDGSADSADDAFSYFQNLADDDKEVPF